MLGDHHTTNIDSDQLVSVADRMSAIGTKHIQPQPYLSAIGVIADIDEPAPRGGIKKIYAINTAERPDSPSLN